MGLQGPDMLSRGWYLVTSEDIQNLTDIFLKIGFVREIYYTLYISYKCIYHNAREIFKLILAEDF